jgi:hypothetical protein
VPIIKTDKEYLEDAPSASEVKDVPDNFKKWVENNQERIAAAREGGTEPYFIKDNAQQVDGILNANNKLSPLEIAAQRHAARTPEQIADIQRRWAEHEEFLKVNMTPQLNHIMPLFKKPATVRKICELTGCDEDVALQYKKAVELYSDEDYTQMRQY